ncbi:MAG: methionine--tRNA ligase subunit beta, partial [Candidatus Ranarchaeia archaeon]
DNCGRALGEGELLNPVCFICKSPATLKETKHWFLKLSKFQDWLAKWIGSGEVKLPSIGKQFLLGQYLNQELHDIAITRDLDWGIPVPLPNTEGKVLYVWFDAPIGYVDSTKQWAEKKGNADLWKDYWLDPGTEIIHFIGKGILYHHSLFWPSVLKGIGWRTPTAIPAYGYATLEGFKLSKERGWVVNLSDFLNRYSPDSLRYYWLSVSPLKEDADFNWEEFRRKHNNELTDTLGNFVHRVLTFTVNNFASTVPEVPHIGAETKSIHDTVTKFSSVSADLLKMITRVYSKIEKSVNDFEIRTGIIEIVSLARRGNKYFNERTPWKTIKTDHDHAAETIFVSIQVVQALAQLCEPYLPFTSEKIWAQLGKSSDIHTIPWSNLDRLLPPGHRIGAPSPIFHKIEAKQILEEKKRLQETTKKAMLKLGKEPHEMYTISIDVFKKVKLVTGKVVDVIPIKNSNKLLKMMIDLGEPKPRQIVAGLAGVYQPRDLIGKNVVVVANLKPAKLLGTMSYGMVLAAENDGVISLLSSDKDLPPGSRIL